MSEASGGRRPGAADKSKPTRRVLEAIEATFGKDAEGILKQLKYDELTDTWWFTMKETQVNIEHEGRMSFKQEK